MLSGDAFWARLASLGTLLGLVLGLLGSLGAPFGTSWGTFFAQVGPSEPKITKKLDFLSLTSAYGTDLGAKLGPKIEENSIKIDVKNTKE